MSDEPRHASSPREWMNRARSNLAIAKNRIPDVYLEDLCFDAQQAAEKAIKAVFLARGIEFPFIHDLTRLSCDPGEARRGHSRRGATIWRIDALRGQRSLPP